MPKKKGTKRTIKQHIDPSVDESKSSPEQAPEPMETDNPDAPNSDNQDTDLATIDINYFNESTKMKVFFSCTKYAQFKHDFWC